MSTVVPMGPFHPALEEPYKIEVTCVGERITDADITVGFNFRGVEWLAERKTWTQDIALLERICGICSNVHTMTFSRAIEQLAGPRVNAASGDRGSRARAVHPGRGRRDRAPAQPPAVGGRRL